MFKRESGTRPAIFNYLFRTKGALCGKSYCISQLNTFFAQYARTIKFQDYSERLFIYNLQKAKVLGPVFARSRDRPGAAYWRVYKANVR